MGGQINFLVCSSDLILTYVDRVKDNSGASTAYLWSSTKLDTSVAPTPHMEMFNPNPNFGSRPLLDVVKALLSLVYIIPDVLLTTAVRRLRYGTKLTLSDDLQRCAMRCAIGILPTSLMRWPTSLIYLQNSTRFSAYASAIDIPVTHTSFAARWIVRGSLTHANTPPSASDIVILYIHGGGYVIGTPGLTADTLLYMAQELETRSPGLRVSILSLDYSLAPEGPFPAQIAETAACYEWLIREQGVTATKIALGGESAGGNIALGFLIHLQTPLEGVAARCSGLDKPGLGTILFSPWIDLTCKGTTYKTNANLDMLPLGGLELWASCLFRGSKYTIDSPEAQRYAHLLSKHAQHADWKAIMPLPTYISVGSFELFFSDISDFVERIRGVGVEVEFDIGIDEPHVWQFYNFRDGVKQWLNGANAGECAKALDLPIHMLLKAVQRHVE